MSLDFYSEFATDEALENDGAWFPVGKGTELLIARSNNRKYSKMLMSEVEKFRAVLDLDDDVANKKNDEIFIACMAEHILRGWKNVTYKGKALDYSVANAKLVLQHKDLRDRVGGLAGSIEGYRVKQEAEQGEA